MNQSLPGPNKLILSVPAGLRIFRAFASLFYKDRLPDEQNIDVEGGEDGDGEGEEEEEHIGDARAFV